jgi:fructokinase
LFVRTDRILVAGETLVDLLPSENGALAAIDGFTHRPGGAPANVASGLAALGDAPPAFWTRLGDDAFGDFLAGALADWGLDGALVERGDAPTALAVVTPERDADRQFTFYEQGTATLDFDADSLPAAALAGVDCVHVGGLALARPGSRDATLALAERARDADCLVSFDPNYRPELCPDSDAARGQFEAALALADLVCCSASDLAPFGLADRARSAPEEVARDLLDSGPDTVFLTRGADGATVASTEPGACVTHSLPAFDVDSVDATGAGDAFCAAALAAFDPGLSATDLRDVLASAAAAGGLATTERGGFGVLPGADAVRALADSTNA